LQQISIPALNKKATVETSSPDLLSYPYIQWGINVVLMIPKSVILRNYLVAGGFAH
jgi:hypothetical protein